MKVYTQLLSKNEKKKKERKLWENVKKSKAIHPSYNRNTSEHWFGAVYLSCNS